MFVPLALSDDTVAGIHSDGTLEVCDCGQVHVAMTCRVPADEVAAELGLTVENLEVSDALIPVQIAGMTVCLN